MIREAIITTLSAADLPHITPLGFRVEHDRVLLAPFVPSSTLDNLRRHGEAVLNFTDDVRVFAGCLTGRREWPTVAASQCRVPRLRDVLAHWELRVEEFVEHPERPQFLCRVIKRETHEPFTGFNRAQAAVVELAILVSRLDWLEPARVASEMSWLQVAIDKTAGEREHLAWTWLVEAVRQHPRHGAKALGVTP